MAKKDMGLSKVKYFDPKQVKLVAQKHVTMMYDRVFQKGKDKDGNQLPDYSESYTKLIKRGFKKKDGTNYKSFKETPTTPAGKLSKHMPVVTRLLARAFRAISWHRDYYEIGWNESKAASKAKWLEDMGRDFVSAIPSKEFDWVANQYGLAAEKEWKKLKNVTVTVGK